MDSYMLFLLLCITALSIGYIYTILDNKKQSKQKKSYYDKFYL